MGALTELCERMDGFNSDSLHGRRRTLDWIRELKVVHRMDADNVCNWYNKEGLELPTLCPYVGRYCSTLCEAAEKACATKVEGGYVFLIPRDVCKRLQNETILAGACYDRDR